MKSGRFCLSKCVPKVAAKWPPAEKPLIPIWLAFMSHSDAFCRMIFIASLVSESGMSACPLGSLYFKTIPAMPFRVRSFAKS